MYLLGIVILFGVDFMYGNSFDVLYLLGVLLLFLVGFGIVGFLLYSLVFKLGCYYDIVLFIEVGFLFGVFWLLCNGFGYGYFLVFVVCGL